MIMKNDATPNSFANPFGDITQVMQQFKLPGVDMSSVVQSRSKDIEALVEANKSAYQSMQAMATRQSEMLKETMQSIQEAALNSTKNLASTDAGKQAELVRQACDKALSDMKELAEMAAKSQADAMSHIPRRASEQMEELKRLMQPTK